MVMPSFNKKPLPVHHTIHTQFKLASWSFDQEASLFVDHLAMTKNATCTSRNYIKEIAFNRQCAMQMVQNLERAGFYSVPFGQGYKDMSPPTKELMKPAQEERLAHGGHPALS